MEIILKQDIPNLGYVNDLVKVKDGYARNFLIPQGKAIIASESNKKALAEMKRQQQFKEERIVKEAQTLADAIRGLELRIAAKAGTSGKIFGSVNTIQIANAIKEERNIEVDRKMIHIDADSVKELGHYIAKVKFHKEVETEVKFEVYAE